MQLVIMLFCIIGCWNCKIPHRWVRDVLLALLVVLVLTCCTRFGVSGSEVSSRHQEQNRKGGKAQSGQYTACWAGLLHLVSEHVTARPNMLYIVRFGPYRPHGFVPGDASSLLSLTPQNAYNMLAPALLIRPATHPSPADVGSYNPLPLRSPTTPSAPPDSR
jgi:hypothetical protein